MLDKSLLPEPEETIGFVSYRTSLSLRQNLLKQFKDNGFDITVEQWAVIYRIFKHGGMSQNQIADKVFKQGPNITRIIDDLEIKTLVYRQQDPDDRRKYLLFLTDKGADLALNVLKVVKETIAQVLDGVKADDLVVTINVLNKIYHNINPKEELNVLDSFKNAFWRQD